MTLKDIKEWDRRSFEKIKNFQLPHYFKRIGLIALFVLLIGLISIKILDLDAVVLRIIIKYGMLVGLLTVSLSKERVEDERIVHIRQQSYQVAFIVGVLYSILLLPLINYVLDYLMKVEDLTFQVSAWEVLAIMLMMQIAFFRLMLKKCS